MSSTSISARGPAAPAEPALVVGSWLWAHLMPLRHRLARGEGLLLLVNVSIAASAGGGALGVSVATGASAVVLALLYLVNDVVDAPRDLADPGKDARFVRFCCAHRTKLAWLLVLEHLAAVALVAALLGPRASVAAVCVFAINLVYSLRLKGMPVLDVPVVMAWGAAYALVTGVDAPPELFGAVGAMTGIAHVFQINRDRAVDRANGIQTSAVAARWLIPTQMAVACALMGLCLAARLGPAWGATAAAPFVLHLTVPSNQAAWLLAKLYYGVVWVLFLLGPGVLDAMGS